MKRVLKLALPIFLIVCCIATLLAFYIINTNKDDDSKTGNFSLKLALSSIGKTVGDKFNLIDSCGIEYEADNFQKPYFKSENYNVLNVNSTNGNAECIDSGKVKVYVYLKVDEDEILTKEVNVSINEKIVYPTSAYLEKNYITLTAGSETINKLIMSENSNAPVSVSYKNGIVSYDYKTGIIKSNGTSGQDVVYIEVSKSLTEKIKLEFTVYVTQKNEIEINQTLSVNQSTVINYDDYLKSGYSNSKLSNFEISDSSVATIVSSSFGYIVVKGLDKGECVIKFNDGTNFIIIKIYVQ